MVPEDNNSIPLGHRASRVGRVILLALLFAVTCCLATSHIFGDRREGVEDAESMGAVLPEHDPMLSLHAPLSHESAGKAVLSDLGVLEGGPAPTELHHNPMILPASESSALWDFPEIKRYQVGQGIPCGDGPCSLPLYPFASHGRPGND